MSGFPDTFVEASIKLTQEDVGAGGTEALAKLEGAGFEVHAGLTEAHAAQIIEMAREPGIREYCPRDCAERFRDLASTANWLAKKRGVFVLLKEQDGLSKVFGYAWVGESSSEHVPGGETTFALRVGSAGSGHGLATPFSLLTLLGASRLYGARKIWLETTESNGAAVHIYHKLGFQDVGRKAYERTDLNGEIVPETRLYMLLPEN